jgi:hypothetical protein
MGISWLSNTTIAVAAGACLDSTHVNDIYVSTSKVINIANNGLNGLDTGAVAASTWYAVYAIGDSTSTRASGYLFSTSATAPTLPYGYDMFKRIGYVQTDGSSHFLLFYQHGTGLARHYTWDAPVVLVNAGTATSYTAFSCITAMPNMASIIDLDVAFTPNAAGDVGCVRASGSASTTMRPFKGSVAAVVERANFSCNTLIVSAAPRLDYIIGAGAVTITGQGWQDSL